MTVSKPKHILIRLAYGNLCVGIVVLLLKYAAYYLTKSVALYSDALESLGNIATAIVALLAIRVSVKPADKHHPFGYYKAEYFSAIFAGFFIIAAGIVILYRAIKTYIHPEPFNISFAGLAINILATLINGVWAWVLIRYGKRYRSPAIIGDGQHLVVDVMTSVGVVVGLLLVCLTGYAKLDPLLAIIIALNILYSGWKLIRESAEGLMDTAPEQKEIDHINAIITENLAADSIHNLKIRCAGRAIFIEFHLVVPGQMTVKASHEICDRIESALKKAYGSATISTIHVEPRRC